VLTKQQPSATGSSWEKYQKTYADDEVEEKKITPLSDESVLDPTCMETQLC
jgi:26S proteasome regulatory subunit T1